MDDHNDAWSESEEPRLLGRFESAADLIAGIFIGLVAAGIAYTFGI